MKVAAYVRVSTLRQAEEGVSIDMQRNIIMKYCLDLKLIDSIEDIVWYNDDGWSAKSLERPSMRSLMEDMKKSIFDTIIAYDMSRISRDTTDLITFLKMATSYGITLKYIYGENKFDTASERFLTTVNVATYQFERERTSERTVDAIMNIADGGRYPFGGMLHYGYYRDAEKNLIINESQAEIIRKMFQMAADGYRLRDIADIVNELQDDIKFDNARVIRYLKNPKYIGVVDVYGKTYEGLIPAIVSKELQQRALSKMIIHSPKSKEYIFSKVLICKKCKKTLKCKSGYGKMKKLYFYYVCPTCEGKVSQIDMDRQVRICMKFVVNKDLKTQITDLKLVRNRIKNKIAKIKIQLDHERISIESFDLLNLHYMEEIDELDRRINAMKETIDIVNYADLKTNDQKKVFVEKYVKKIIVDIPNKKIFDIEYRD